MIACIYENRLDYLIGVKLTVLSLARHCPDLPVMITCPQAPESFRLWVEKQPNAELGNYDSLDGVGWNVKPSLLLQLLEEGYSDVVWIDSDIIINRDFRQHFENLCEDTLVVTQEVYWGQYQGGNYRTVAWGLQPGRDLSTTVNTGIVRVTSQHIELLTTWQKMLNEPAYVSAQSLPYYERPIHMIGDQEVFTALLGGTEFSQVPIKMLERGVDIAQCFGPAGYTPNERWQQLRQNTSLPALIHCMGRKSWTATSVGSIWSSQEPLKKRLRAYYDLLHLELSPYTSVAREYREQISEDVSWMNPKTTPARLLIMLSDNPTIYGFPLALFDSGVRHARRLFNIGRYQLN
ncbi:putative nucleotide-diphospho-sugar transferase [Nodularia sp. NIES-3585]|uniref:putative nucleotide-diphospho-sugar transferase n=1 Tax=Nodularia sp. NIES-3585 TaxID=1973477 RepID=UPI000B5C7AA1|nr:putative nucleotide-diphospho-sugar transferase [Nodularia sp. NIES-3585]GAX37573.1 hypothetical protein NIES3585_36180 [Nodularia sp. NIES-3585]